MALSDPITVTVNSVANVLPRIADGVYQSADTNTKVLVRQSNTKERFRREVRFDRTVVAADPISAVNKSLTASVYIIVDEPRYGFNDTELGQFVEGLKAFYVAGIYNKILGGEK